MAQDGNPPVNLPFWARRPAPRAKRFYDLEVLPQYAQRGGHARASVIAALPVDEQHAIVTRLTVERVRAMARRKGKPDPIFVEAVLKPLPGGGFVVEDGPEVPLRPEWGGDTIEAALLEAKRAKLKDHLYIANLKLAQTAEKHRRKLEALGYTVTMGEAGVEIKSPAKAKRKA
jgi:hypothetical protein